MSAMIPGGGDMGNILGPKIAVVGVGGAGSNAVDNMIRAGLTGVTFLVCNTDAQALNQSLCPENQRLRLGFGVTQGLGAGSSPDVGRAAGEESIDEIIAHLKGIHMIFVTAGMGGGTGTGASPVICKAAREQGILTVGVVTKPFHFEGTQRMRVAERGIETIRECVDTLLVIPNQNLFRLATQNTTFIQAFAMADEVLNSGVRTFTDLMLKPGLVNCDFADICTVMRNMKGKAMMGTGEATGEQRATEAAEKAIGCLLLDDVSIHGAKAVLINITGGLDLTLYDVDEAIGRIKQELEDKEMPGREPTHIIFGATFDKDMSDVLRVSVVATGIEDTPLRPPFVIPSPNDFPQNFPQNQQASQSNSTFTPGSSEDYKEGSKDASPQLNSKTSGNLSNFGQNMSSNFGPYEQKPVSYNTLGSRHGDYGFDSLTTQQPFSLQENGGPSSFGSNLYGPQSFDQQNYENLSPGASDFFMAHKKEQKDFQKIETKSMPAKQEDIKNNQHRGSWFDRFLKKRPMEKTLTTSSHNAPQQDIVSQNSNNKPTPKFFHSSQKNPHITNQENQNENYEISSSVSSGVNTKSNQQSPFVGHGPNPNNQNFPLGFQQSLEKEGALNTFQQNNGFSPVYYPQDNRKGSDKSDNGKNPKDHYGDGQNFQNTFYSNAGHGNSTDFSEKSDFSYHQNQNRDYSSEQKSSSLDEALLPSFLKNKNKDTPNFLKPNTKKK